jgi:hypothetical protein
VESLFDRRQSARAFSAGRAIVDAYNYERQQNWVGIMIAPSALREVRDVDFRNKCTTNAFNTEAFPDLDTLAWPACIQRCNRIPFHQQTWSPTPPDHDGFAIIPGNGTTDPPQMLSAVRKSREHLDWLRSVAPSPTEQMKYQKTGGWISEIEGALGSFTGNYESWKLKQAEIMSQFTEVK